MGLFPEFLPSLTNLDFLFGHVSELAEGAESLVGTADAAVESLAARVEGRVVVVPLFFLVQAVHHVVQQLQPDPFLLPWNYKWT